MVQKSPKHMGIGFKGCRVLVSVLRCSEHVQIPVHFFLLSTVSHCVGGRGPDDSCLVLSGALQWVPGLSPHSRFGKEELTERLTAGLRGKPPAAKSSWPLSSRESGSTQRMRSPFLGSWQVSPLEPFSWCLPSGALPPRADGHFRNSSRLSF